MFRSCFARLTVCTGLFAISAGRGGVREARFGIRDGRLTVSSWRFATATARLDSIATRLKICARRLVGSTIPVFFAGSRAGSAGTIPRECFRQRCWRALKMERRERMRTVY